MSRKIFGLLAVFVLMLLLTGSAQAQLQTPDDDGRNVRDPYRTALPPGGDDNNHGGIGDKIAGAWVGTGFFALDFDCDGVGDVPPGPPFTDVQSFSAGGLHVGLNPGNPNSGPGTWRKTGPRQVSAQDILFINTTTADLVTGAVTTEVSLIARIEIVVDFEHNFEAATSTFGARLYNPDQDPLVDAPFLCTAGQHTLLRKVPATP
jgi:hypothetical protein